MVSVRCAAPSKQWHCKGGFTLMRLRHGVSEKTTEVEVGQRMAELAQDGK